MDLQEIVAGIGPVDERAMAEAQRRWDSIAHPLNSLGMLERDIIRIAGITGDPNVDLSKKAVVAMCADNGVVAEGVTQTGQDVTAIVTENMSKGDTSVCCMARVAGAQVIPVDIGVARPVAGEHIRQCCVRRGTANMTKGPAMTREEAVQAVLTGVELVGELKEQGVRLLATGEMGIGNTTTSSAIVSVLLGKAPAEVTGRGAGLTSEGDVLYKVGGLDIAGLAGVVLGGAYYRIPVLVDGFISSAAALMAAAICPACKNYMLASHASNEPAGRMVLEALGLEPFLYAGMCLGEGTGAVAVMPLLEMGAAVSREMCTFEATDIEAYEHLT